MYSQYSLQGMLIMDVNLSFIMYLFTRAKYCSFKHP